MRYAELQVTTNFSFLRGGSHAEELIAHATVLGLDAIAITDRNTLSGVVRAHVAAKEAGLRLVIGARLDLTDGPSLLCFPTDRAAYGRLCRLLSLGQGRARKGQCILHLDDVAAFATGQIFVALPPEDGPQEAGPQEDRSQEDGPPDDGTGLYGTLNRLKAALGATPLYLAASNLYRSDDRARIAMLSALAKRCATPLVATNDVLYHAPHRRPLQDVLTCVRNHTTIAEAGFHLEANAERHLKKPSEIARLFAGFEDAIERTIEIVTACRFSLDELVYEYPDEPVPPGKTAQAHLEALTFAGAHHRFPQGVPADVDATLERELALIKMLNYAPYFLTVHDIVAFARSRGILCQGRGSAANSCVCYVLGITAVNPTEVDLLFERFISSARKEPPDIDVDFEHERREEVIQYIYARYGRDRAGLAATVISYRARSAVRDVGRAMGLSEDTVSALAGRVWGTRSGGTLPEKHVREAGLDPTGPLLATVLELSEDLIGFPRHLSQHVGGFVLTRGPLTEVVPVGNAAMADRTFIEWDKDDIAALGLLKIDVLALGMLSCIRRAFALLDAHHRRPMSLARVPREDAATYDMLCRADSIGVFQVESRAQMNMLPRLKPRTFYDLVIEVAIVRPGPIQGDMVHPYLRRRSGTEAEFYPAPSLEHGPPDELKNILGKTKGVPLFQEQAMRIAMVAAKFSDEDVNELRKAMATFRRRGTIGLLQDKMIGAMVARGYDPEFSTRCFNQIKGFGEYGFPESHAASFAHLVYVSSWLKCHFPAAFACGLLNSQPMGFYAPAQIVRDAAEHRVRVLPVDVNHSGWDCTLEFFDSHEGTKARKGSAYGEAAFPLDGCSKQETQNNLEGLRPAQPLRAFVPSCEKNLALRLGLRQIDGFPEAAAARLVAAREEGGMFCDLRELKDRAALSPALAERLASADCFASLGLSRRQALWDARSLIAAPDLPLFAHAAARDEGAERAATQLPKMRLSEEVVTDYQTQRLSLKAHPLAFLRADLAERGFVRAADLRERKVRTMVQVAGVVLIRQRPGSAKGVCFITLEDETGVVNLVIWPDLMEKQRRVIMGARLMEVRGRVEYDDEVIHVIAANLTDATAALHGLSEDLLEPSIARADEVNRPVQSSRGHPRNVRVIPKSRDFH